MKIYKNEFNLNSKEELQEIRESIYKYFERYDNTNLKNQVKGMSNEEFISLINHTQWLRYEDERYDPAEVTIKSKGKFTSFDLSGGKVLKKHKSKVYLGGGSGELTSYRVRVIDKRDNIKKVEKLFQETLSEDSMGYLVERFFYKKDAEEFYNKVVELYSKE